MYYLRIVTYVRAMENEHRISKVSLSEAINIIYISTNPAELSDHVSLALYIRQGECPERFPVSALSLPIKGPPRKHDQPVCLSPCFYLSV